PIHSQFSTACFPRPDFVRSISIPRATPRRLLLLPSADKRFFVSRVGDFHHLVRQCHTHLLAELSLYRASILTHQEQAWRTRLAANTPRSFKQPLGVAQWNRSPESHDRSQTKCANNTESAAN